MPMNGGDLDRLMRRMTLAGEYIRRHHDLLGMQISAFKAMDDRNWRSMQHAANMATQPGFMAALQETTRRWKQYTDLLEPVSVRTLRETLRTEQIMDRARLAGLTSQLSGPGLVWSAVLAEQGSSLADLDRIYRSVTAFGTPAMQKVVEQVGSLNSVMAGYHGMLAAMDNSVLQTMPARLGILVARPMVRLDELSGHCWRSEGSCAKWPCSRPLPASGAATTGIAVVQRSAITVVEGFCRRSGARTRKMTTCPVQRRRPRCRRSSGHHTPGSAQLDNPDLYQKLGTLRITRIAASIVNGLRDTTPSAMARTLLLYGSTVEACLTLTQYARREP